MKLPKLFLLTALFGLLFSGDPAFSSDKQLVLNNEVFCDMSQATIDSSGDLRVTLASLEECVGTGVGLAVSPLVAVPDSVAPGDNFQAVWSSVGADECTLVLPSGWSAGAAGLSGATTVTVPSSASTTTYSLDVICGAGFEEESSSVEVAVVEADPESPPSTPSFSANVTESTAPGEVVLTWTPSSTATACEAESSPTVSQWNGSVSASGSNNQVTLSGLAADSYTFRLRCSNAAGNSNWVQRSATISSSAECADRAPPSGWTRVTNGCRFIHGQGWGGDCSNWNPGIWSNPFWDGTGTTRRLGLAGRNGSAETYLAIQIDTTDMPSNKTGRITVEHDTFATATPTLVSISSCPGDFHGDAVLAETGCYARQAATAGGGSSFRWGGTNSDRDCQLESGRTYYFNIIPTTSPEGTHPDEIEPSMFCESSTCGLIYEPQ